MKPLRRLIAIGLGWALLGPASAEDVAVQRWSLEDGLPQSTVTAIAQDSDGYLWLGTEAGLVRFDGRRFTLYDRSNTPELRTDHISALLVDEQGSLWIGTRNGLVLHRRNAFEVFTEEQGLPDDVVEALLIGPGGDLWVGTRGGLCSIAGAAAGFCEEAEELEGKEIFALALATDESVWAGTRSGLQRLADGRFEAPRTLAALEQYLFLSLESDPRGSLWAGTAGGGLFRIGVETLQASAVTTAREEIILSLHHDPQGVLWIGTRAGLKRYENGTLTRIGALAEDTIYNLFRDGSDHLWIGTRNDGVFRLPLANATTDSIPPVLIEDVRVNGASLPREELAASPPRGRGDLEFHFTAVEFVAAESLRFRHFLEGYHDTWTEPSTQRYASFTNLSPGSYRFRVRLADPRFDHGAAHAELSFRIEPLFHQTALFRVTIFLLIGLALFGIYQLRVRRLLHKQATLKTALGEHTREILEQKEEISSSYRRLERANRLLRKTNRELTKRNREKSDFLAIATHDLRAPLVNLKGFTAELAFAFERAERCLQSALEHLDPAQRAITRETLNEDLPEYIEFINSSAERIESLIDPILKISRINRRTLQFRPISLADLVETQISLNRERLEAQGVRCEAGKLDSLLADESVLRETLDHLLQHTLASLEGTEGGRIDFSSHRTSTETVVTVRRNGPPAEQDTEDRAFRIFGRNGIEDGTKADVEMTYARALVQRLGGRIWLRQQSDSTTIYFSIPTNPGQAHH